MKTSIKALIAGTLILTGVSGCVTYDDPVYRSYPIHRVGDLGPNYHWMPSEHYSGGVYLYGGNRNHCSPQIQHHEQSRVGLQPRREYHAPAQRPSSSSHTAPHRR